MEKETKGEMDMKRLDKETQQIVAQAIEEGIRKGLEKALILTDVWLSADGVVEQFAMLKKDFVTRRGNLLPRSKGAWRDKNGVVHETGSWAYSRNGIAEMIADGRIMCMEDKD